MSRSTRAAKPTAPATASTPASFAPTPLRPTFAGRPEAFGGWSEAGGRSEPTTLALSTRRRTFWRRSFRRRTKAWRGPKSTAGTATATATRLECLVHVVRHEVEHTLVVAKEVIVAGARPIT